MGGENQHESNQGVFGGSSSTTTYSYNKEWTDHPVDSTYFYINTGNMYDNPGAEAFFLNKEVFCCQHVQLGEFIPPEGLKKEHKNNTRNS